MSGYACDRPLSMLRMTTRTKMKTEAREREKEGGSRRMSDIIYGPHKFSIVSILDRRRL